MNEVVSIYDPCPCNSGKKFKFCCYALMQQGKDEEIAKAAVNFPLHLCGVGANWQDMGITTATIAKKLPNGKLLVATYLVDIWCLGVKSIDLKMNMSYDHFQIFLQKVIESEEGTLVMEYEDFRSLILGSVKYAESIGFAPCKEWAKVAPLVEPERSFEDKYPFGKDGKPFYVVGPYDALNVGEIVKKVEKSGGDHMTPAVDPY